MSFFPGKCSLSSRNKRLLKRRVIWSSKDVNGHDNNNGSGQQSQSNQSDQDEITCNIQSGLILFRSLLKVPDYQVDGDVIHDDDGHSDEDDYSTDGDNNFIGFTAEQVNRSKRWRTYQSSDEEDDEGDDGEDGGSIDTTNINDRVTVKESAKSCKNDGELDGFHLDKKKEEKDQEKEKVKHRERDKEAKKPESNQSLLSKRRIADWINPVSKKKLNELRLLKKVPVKNDSDPVDDDLTKGDDRRNNKSYRKAEMAGILKDDEEDDFKLDTCDHGSLEQKSLSRCSSSSSLSSSCSHHSIIKHYTNIMMNSGGENQATDSSSVVKEKIDRILKSQWEERLNRSKEKSSISSNLKTSTASAKNPSSSILRPSKLQLNQKTWLKLKKSNLKTDWLFNDDS